MLKSRGLLTMAAAAALGAGCARYSGTAGGDIASIDPDAAANTVVLQALNVGDESIELRIIAQNQSRFVGAVQPRDTTAILLDPSLFPSAQFYVVGIAADPSHRVVAGPLAAGKGDRIMFRIEPQIRSSRAYVTHGSGPR